MPFASAPRVELRFEWDAQKAKDNITRHDVAFEEAATVFRDPLELMSSDVRHSVTEERWISIGMSDAQRLLVVCYTQHGATIRIISARLPTIQERKAYEEGEA